MDAGEVADDQPAATTDEDEPAEPDEPDDGSAEDAQPVATSEEDEPEEQVEDDRGPVVEEEWSIAFDSVAEGVHTIVMIKTFSPLEEADIEEMGGRLVWDETEVDLCRIEIRSVGEGWVQIGDIFQTAEACDGERAMQQAVADFGPPESACVYVRVGGVDDEYCALLTMGVAEVEEDEEALDDDGTPPSEGGEDEWRELIDDVIPEGPAPAGLAGVVLPTDIDGVNALFDALPDELIGGEKTITDPTSMETPGDLGAQYLVPDRASRYGFQAMDLSTSFIGSILPEPRADMLVAFFVLSDDDDYIVEAAGHEGELYWVTLTSFNSGFGIEGVEEVYTLHWGEARSRWSFVAGAPTEAQRDELIVAFIAAAATLPE